MRVVASARAVVRASSFALWTSGAVNTLRMARRLSPYYRGWEGTQSAIKQWARGLVPIFGLDLQVGGAPPQDPGPYLVVSNHRSPVDILLGLHLVGGVVLSHHGVAKLPVIGDAARINETIFVDRDDRSSGARAMRAIRRNLQDGRNVIVFPEGSTFEGDAVRPFRPGTFASARYVPGVRIFPMGLAYEPGAEYTDDTFGKHLFRMTSQPKTRVCIQLGEPCDVPPRGDEEAVRLVVQDLVDRAAALRDRGT